MAGYEAVDFAAIAERARQVSEQLADAQVELEESEVTGFGGGGLVRATVSGAGRLLGLSIDPSAIDPDDPDELAALVVSAVDEAQRAAITRRESHLDGVTAALGGLSEGLAEVRPQPLDVIPRMPDRSARRRPPRG